MSKSKTFLLCLFYCVFLLLCSETVNYLKDPSSRSSAYLNNMFIKKAILASKNSNLNKSIFYLFVASDINVFGEYHGNRNLLPDDFSEKLTVSQNEDQKEIFLNYIKQLTKIDIQNNEDQGLGKIFYDLSLLSFNTDSERLGLLLLKKAMYNNPEFASFHAELINYYFRINDLKSVDAQLEYCAKFEKAKTLCQEYKNDSIRQNVPKDIGYMKNEVEKHYLLK